MRLVQLMVLLLRLHLSYDSRAYRHWVRHSAFPLLQPSPDQLLGHLRGRLLGKLSGQLLGDLFG